MMSTKKILCIGPFKQPSNAYLRTISFSDLGCLVERVDISDSNVGKDIISRIKRRLYKPIYRILLLKAIKKKIQEFNPDLIFIEKGIDFNLKNLLSFKVLLKKNGKIAHLNPDDPFGDFDFGWDNFIQSIPLYDFHFVPKEINKIEYISHGAKKVHIYDRSFAPGYHKLLEVPASKLNQFRCGIGFIGSYAPYRESIINALVNSGINITIWGDGWSKGKYWDNLKSSWKGGSQIGNNYIYAISCMDIALHFVRHENRDLHDSRTFEIPACGTFMLAERTKDHERLFKEDKEIVLFDSELECINKCHFYLNNPTLRKKIAAAGRQRLIKSKYDYHSRSKQMLDIIEANDPDDDTWIGA